MFHSYSRALEEVVAFALLIRDLAMASAPLTRPPRNRHREVPGSALSAGLPMWGAWCKTLVRGFSLGEWEPLCPRPTLPEAACNTAGGLGGAVSPPAGSGRERILAIMYIKFASNNVPGKISVHKKILCGGGP